MTAIRAKDLPTKCQQNSKHWMCIYENVVDKGSDKGKRCYIETRNFYAQRSEECCSVVFRYVLLYFR